MIDTMTNTKQDDGMSKTAAATVWIGLVAAASVLGSLAFACAAPLAAIAALAGLKMRTCEGLALVGAAWLANQLVGYLILGYPQSWDSFGWGAAIGVASLLAFAAAALVARLRAPAIAAVAAGFLAAFAAYEAALFAATAVLPSSEAAFSGAAVLRILEVNAVALVLLLLAHRAAAALGLRRPLPLAAPAAA